MTKPFKDHFSQGSNQYAAHRPTYPQSLVDELVRISPHTELALDCGCGTGQLSVLLAKRFSRVVATDASEAQIEEADRSPGVEYRVALAEESALPEHSVDLITVAQAAHWLDLEKFYKEVRRVGKPGAAIVLISYGVLHLEGELDAIVQNFYHTVLNGYWPPERRHVEEGYKNLPFPFEELKLKDLHIEVDWNLSDLVGYFKTWSAVRAAEKALGKNPVDTVEDALRNGWGDPLTRRKLKFPLSTRAGKVAATNDGRQP